MGGPWKQQAVELWRPGLGMSHRASTLMARKSASARRGDPARFTQKKASEKEASAADLPMCGKVCAERWSGLPVFEKQHYAVVE